MPDRAGRFNLQDGLDIARTVLSIKDMQDSTEERRKDKARRAKIEENLSLYAKGEKPDPKAEGYDAVADIEAQGVWMRNALQNEQFKAARLEADQRQAEVNKPKIDQVFNATVAAYKSYEAEQDPAKRQALARQVLDTALPMYDFVPNGTKYKGIDEKAGVLKFKNIAGQDVTEQIPDPKTVVLRASKFAQNYGDYYHSAREKLREFNAKQMLNYVREKSEDGQEALHFTMLDMDDKGDYVPRETWRDPKDPSKVIKGFDEQTGKEVKSDNDFKPMKAYKEEADIKHTQAQTRALEATDFEKAADKAQDRKAKEIKEAKDKLSYELQPFAGSKPVVDDMGNITQDGKTALDAAIHLVAKYRSKAELTDAEKAKLKHALNAVRMYEKDSSKLMSGYRNPGGGTGQNVNTSDYVKNLIEKSKSGS